MTTPETKRDNNEAIRISAEQCVIGSAIQNGSTISDLRALGIVAAMFRPGIRRALWVALDEHDQASFLTSNDGVDPVILREHVVRSGAPWAADVIRVEIVVCAEAIPSVAHWSDYGAALIRCHEDDVISQALAKTQTMTPADARDYLSSIFEDLDERRAAIFEADEISTGAKELREIIDATGNPIKSSIIPTGAMVLDHARGVERGALIIGGARPSVGKTSFGVHVAASLAERRTKSDIADGTNRIGIVTLEMKTRGIWERVVANRSLVRLNKLKGDPATVAERAAVERAAADIFDGGALRIASPKSRTLDDVRRVCRTLVQKHKCSFVVVDYLGCIAVPGARDQVARITAVSEGMKAAAMALDVPLLLLCQLNRDASKEQRAPKLSDLRDSGAIEQDADVVIALSRLKEEDNTRVRAEILKSRNGPIGAFVYDFDGATQRFQEPPSATTGAQAKEISNTTNAAQSRPKPAPPQERQRDFAEGGEE